MKRKFFVLVCLLLSLGLVSAVEWDTVITYDDFVDGIVDPTLWTNTTTGTVVGLNVTIAEETYIVGNTSASSGAAREAFIQSINLPTQTGALKNLTFRVRSDVFSGGAGGGTACGNLDIFGFNVVTNCLTNTGTGSITHVEYTITRDPSEGTSQGYVLTNNNTGSTTPFNATNSNMTINATIYGSISDLTRGEVRIYSLEYQYGEEAMNITLNDPVDNKQSLVNDQTFDVTADVLVNNLRNITLYIDGVVNGSTVSWSGTVNQTTLNRTLSNGVYNWSVEVCDDDNNCKFSENRTLTVADVVFNTNSYTAVTTEGVNEYFETNVTIASDVSISSANLQYDGVNYSATINQIAGDNYMISRELAIPLVSSDVNNTFEWIVTLNTGSKVSESNTQSVLNLNIDDCSSYSVVILNYTLYDEDTQSVLNGTINLDVDLSTLGTTSAVIEFSQQYVGVNEALVCLQTNLTNEYRLDAATQYTADNHTTEFHHLQNVTLGATNIPQNISLYNLLTTRAKEFVITFKDGTLLPVSDALIDITRKYVSEGVFKTVEIPMTDNGGKAVASLVENDEIYTFVISKNGQVLATFDNVVAVCQNDVIDECNINLNALSTSTELTDFTQYNGVSLTENFNHATRTITVTFSSTSGAAATVSINATKFDRFQNTTACSDSLTSSSGTLTCVVPAAIGNASVISEVYVDGVKVSQKVYTLAVTSQDLFGLTAVIALFSLMGALVFMFIGSPVMMILASILGMIFAAVLVISTNASIFGAASSLMWLIVAGGILLWRITKGGRSV